jgi:hypothetical protein
VSNVKAQAALSKIADDLSDADSFIETFDPEDWGDPDRFGEAAQAETNAAFESLKAFIGAVEDLVSEHFVDTGDSGPYEVAMRRVSKYLFEQES